MVNLLCFDVGGELATPLGWQAGTLMRPMSYLQLPTKQPLRVASGVQKCLQCQVQALRTVQSLVKRAQCLQQDVQSRSDHSFIHLPAQQPWTGNTAAGTAMPSSADTQLCHQLKKSSPASALSSAPASAPVRTASSSVKLPTLPQHKPSQCQSSSKH